MYEISLSTLFRKQIKIIAMNDQKLFLDICDSWDTTHKDMNKQFGKKGSPFQEMKFAERVKNRKLFIIYNLKEDTKELWINLVAKQIGKNRYLQY